MSANVLAKFDVGTATAFFCYAVKVDLPTFQIDFLADFPVKLDPIGGFIDGIVCKFTLREFYIVQMFKVMEPFGDGFGGYPFPIFLQNGFHLCHRPFCKPIHAEEVKIQVSYLREVGLRRDTYS